MKDFLWKCLKLKPEERPPLEELNEHPFINSKIELLPQEEEKSTEESTKTNEEMDAKM